MAAATARSPSPGPGARPGCAVRRSADSSPAASPCDLAALRSSVVCRNASPRASWCAEKENSGQRDAAARAAAAPKPARPAAGAAKNFMAPTISAASKASPRKKVLGERNEQQQLYPVASSPVKPMASEAGAPRRLRLSFDGAPNTAPPAASTPVTAAAGSRHSFGGEEERRVENPPCKNHHHATAFDDAASAEADQGAAPYDPRTNYLSPRPRFLHYKPNPRIDLYRQGSSGGVRRLEDGFASESSEETVTTTTTTSSEEEVVLVDEEQQAHLSSELGDGAAVPAADACALPLEPASGSPRARVLTPEPATRSPRARVQTPEPEPTASSERARRPRKRSSLRFLVAPLALVVFMAAALICVPPPPVDSPVMPLTALSKVSDFLSVQELHPVELAAWLKQWSSSSLNLVTSYWESLVWAQEQEFFGPHFAANLSAATASAHEGVDLYCNFVETRPVLMEDIGASAFEQDSKIQEAVSASDSELISEISDVEQEDITDKGDVIDDGFLAEELNVEMPEEDAEMSQEVSGSNGEEMASFSQDLEPSQPAGEAEPLENIETSTSSLKQDVQTDDSEGDRAADGEESPEADHGMKSELGMWPSYLDKISKPAAAGAALAAVIVPAALAFLLMSKKQDQAVANAAAEAPADQAEPVVEKTLSGSGSSEGHLRVKGSQLQTPPVADETERFGGGSGASMYSSSLSSGYGRRKSAKEDESLSLDPVSRRDSAAQPTSSYGSFTTYEKIPAKKRNKDDEAVTTPVRRSSRLRNQVKSPEA
ncbi:uncharacterized protein [Oryza sativa Japonica Group]|uniref:Expressed protein n=2 Tax=Oryza sativa subsp. japonica TaxID=39947 RepID=Q84R70_ORYSJ|nr:uncharacterized protein LOC4333695 [Oryza sativa Japonica Group]AAP03384.1 hypothetical protein [Oryza sativa Japonica Group]ABF98131.1 expressed protein [Oryza sativa Japonica Group]BAF12788.1 Os03g0672400 [Oryza sativa Japonica Group]BAS85694.1 Os03g0672400 [Oryza sativa Japonica Group]|eukprot:NP_001050874.1 Os03g0672400 [Oryza sativa Japonica Group]